MGPPYAEVIGNPVAHSKSPLVHRFWLEKLGIDGDYRAVRVAEGELRAHLRRRCGDPFWRGCNVTAPLKGAAARLAVDPTGVCARIGAANALFRSPLGCGVGANTDLIGVAEALEALPPSMNRVCLIGAGGAARAVLEVLRVRGGADVSLIVRDLAAGRRLHSGAVFGFDGAAAALAGADCVVNASPLGMSGAPAMPAALLDALAATAGHALVFDMVYAPAETALLARARTLGRRIVDGYAMLIGQAAPAFELFFGAPAPREHDAELRRRLTS